MLRIGDPYVISGEFVAGEFAMRKLSYLGRFESAVGEGDMRDVYRQRIICDRAVGHFAIEKKLFIGGQVPDRAAAACFINR